MYELEVGEAHRGGGIATHVIELVEAEVRGLGGTAISLREFDHNNTARNLHDRSGYRAVSTLMRKVL